MTDNLLKYKKLSEIEHVLARTGMYLGSVSPTQISGYLLNDDHTKMEWREYEYVPALVKLFDEIISNSVDEHRRSGKVTSIFVNLDKLTGEIVIEDNGGIPVEEHPIYKVYIPSMIFGELRTGSNFDDETGRTTAGLNGLGVKLVSIFSKELKVQTADGKNLFVQVFKNNLSSKSKSVIQPSNKKGTKITFVPDYERLGCRLDDGNYDRIVKRVYDVAGCNPKIKVYLNGQLIKINKFKDYINMYVSEFVEEETQHWHIAVAASSNDSFEQVSFVNGVDTFNGGSHVEYVCNQITNKLREYIKKKHKIDLKPNNIKQQLFLFVNCVVNNPMFTSQTKEFMSSDQKDFGTSYEVSDKFINQLVKSEIVQKILDWAEAQQRQKELAEMRKLNKTTQNTNFLKKIVKFDDASSKSRIDCSLVLTEGDSAKNAIISSRDPNYIGAFPLRGKPLNVRDVKVQKLTANEEIANIMAILGLKIGEDHEIEDLRFGKVLIAADFDPDGQHITGLIVNMFSQLWPGLIKKGLLYRLKTPVIVATHGKTFTEFFSRSEYNKWAEETGIKHSMKWYKGLGSWSTKDFKRFMQNSKYHEPLVYNDKSDIDCIDLAFDRKMADERKEWLAN